MTGFFVAYFLGAFTFWPLVALAAYYTWRSREARPAGGNAPVQEGEESDSGKLFSFNTKTWSDYRHDVDGSADLESDIDASGWVRLAPTYVPVAADPQDDTDPNTAVAANSSGARASLQKIVDGAEPATKVKRVSKYPKYWAVVRGGQLQLFSDSSERKLLDYLHVSRFVVTLWPQGLQEFELFYKRYPIVLLSRTEPQGVVALDLNPGVPPRDAFYLYVENPTNKEDLYFALVKESRAAGTERDVSLGPRDPVQMARPIRVRKSEAQQLQSRVWSDGIAPDTQWLNAFLGRLFLAMKDSPLADDYFRRKFAYKLRPISASSSIIGDIEVRDIHTGSSAPFVKQVKLKELTPDGNMVIAADISYTGGFRVHLATSVKLAAVTSLTSREIPVELAASLRHLDGTLVFRIKPAPSERIWYAFETMPQVELDIEPVVYETQISQSIVTNFIKSRILETLRETLVVPFMDDFAFYSTTSDFYRGGIWAGDDARADSPGKFPRPDLPPRGNSQASLFRGQVPKAPPPSSAVSSTLDVPLEEDAAATTAKSESHSTVRKFSNWMRRQRSSRSLNNAPPQLSSTSVHEDEDDSRSLRSVNSDAASLDASPRSTRRTSWSGAKTSSTTTHVTTMNAAPEPKQGTPSGAKPTPAGRGADASLGSPKRKPVPDEALAEQPVPLGAPLDVYPSTLDPRVVRPATAMSATVASAAASVRSASPPSMFSRLGTSPPPIGEIGKSTATSADAQPRIRRKPVPSELDIPEFEPVSKPVTPSLAESTENATGLTLNDDASVLSQEIEEPLRRTLSISAGRGFDGASVRSGRSSHSAKSIGSGPSLPPRHRRTVPLANVEPERNN